MDERINEYEAMYDDIYDYDINEVKNCSIYDQIYDQKLTSEHKSLENYFNYVNDKKINSQEQEDAIPNLLKEFKNKNNDKKSIESEYAESLYVTDKLEKKKINKSENLTDEEKLNKNYVEYTTNKLNINSVDDNMAINTNKVVNDENKTNKHGTDCCDANNIIRVEEISQKAQLEKSMIREDEINSKEMHIYAKVNKEENYISENINKKNSNNDKKETEFYVNKPNILLNFEDNKHKIGQEKQFNDTINENSVNENYTKMKEAKGYPTLKKNEPYDKSQDGSNQGENDFKFEKNEVGKLEASEIQSEKDNKQREPIETNLKFVEKKEYDTKVSENRDQSEPNQNRNKPNYQESENKSTFECNICFDDVRDPVVTKCGHLFCWLCLCSWIKKNNDCPVCKAEVLKENVIPLYGRGKSSNEHKYTNVEEPRPTPKRKEFVRTNSNSANNLGLRASFGVWVNPFSFGLSYTNMSDQPYFNNNNRNENRRVQTETFHAGAAFSFFFFLGFFLSLYILFYS